MIEIDEAGCFVKDERGNVYFNFGKHEYEKVDAHPDYLKWMLTKSFNDDTIEKVKELLEKMGEWED